jgi:hypothetical protein
MKRNFLVFYNQVRTAMSGRPLERSGSSSSISPFSLEAPPKIKRREDKHPSALSSPFRGQIHTEVATHEGNLPDSNSEPDAVLVNDWVRMKIDLRKIYWGILYANIVVNVFIIWLLLSGFLVLPAAFSSLSISRALNSLGNAGKVVLHAVQNISFLWLAGICFVCGVVGLLLIWREYINNYIWLTNRLFL